MAGTLQVFCYSRCSTCRRAIAWLGEHGLDHNMTDITTHPPSKELLQSAIDQLGGRKPLFNTSGQSYRALGAAAVKAMSDAEALDALAADGRLIKRPFAVCADGAVLMGFKPQEWADRLLVN